MYYYYRHLGTQFTQIGYKLGSEISFQVFKEIWCLTRYVRCFTFSVWGVLNLTKFYKRLEKYKLRSDFRYQDEGQGFAIFRNRQSRLKR